MVMLSLCVCVQVCLLGVRECVLSGELCRVGVEVFNCGQVALNSLRVTSSLAHSLLLELVSCGEVWFL